jgi:hypothetical protein
VSSAILTPPDDAVRTRTCFLWRDRFIFGVFHPGTEVSGDDARENIAASLRIANGRKLPVLVDLRAVRAQSAESRTVFAGAEAATFTAACALVIGSPLSRVLGNFYLGFNRPPTPTRLFVSVDEAMTWLAGFEAPDA